jgi:hypothetical protein
VASGIFAKSFELTNASVLASQVRGSRTLIRFNIASDPAKMLVGFNISPVGMRPIRIGGVVFLTREIPVCLLLPSLGPFKFDKKSRAKWRRCQVVFAKSLQRYLAESARKKSTLFLGKFILFSCIVHQNVSGTNVARGQ